MYVSSLALAVNFELPNNCNKRKLCSETTVVVVVVVVLVIVLRIHIKLALRLG